MKNSTSHIPLLKRPVFALHRQYKLAETKKHQLQYIMWECTLRCNFSCLHCGSDCKKDASKPDMPVADFIKSIDDIMPLVQPENTTVVITGGEPLMRTDLESVGNELKRRRFPWGMVTNGYLLTPEKLNSLIDAGLHAITISLDGFEKSHDWLRGVNGSFLKAIQAIAQVAAKGLVFDVVTCVNQQNFNELEHLRMLLIDLGVKNWRIFTIFPVGRAAQNNALSLSDQQFKALFGKIKVWRTAGDIQVNYGCEGFLGKFEGEVRDNFFFCRAGINIASILVDGSLTGCNNINHQYIQGNIYSQSFPDIWENNFGVMRDRSWMKTGKCKQCRHFDLCLGNGFHLRNENGDLLLCHLEKLENTDK